VHEKFAQSREWADGFHEGEPDQPSVHLAGVSLVDVNLAAPAIDSATIGDIPLQTIHSAGSRPWYVVGPNTSLSTDELLGKISETQQYLIHQMTIELPVLDTHQRSKVLDWLRSTQTVVRHGSFSAYAVGDSGISFNLNNGHLSARSASKLLDQMEKFINNLGI